MKSIESIQASIVKGLVFLLPLFFLPITSEFFDLNKTLLLVFGTLVGILLWALAQIRGEFRLRVTSFDLPVLAFGLVFLASAILVTPNKIDAYVAPGATTFIIFATLLYFLIVQSSRNEGVGGDEGRKEGVVSWLLLGASIAALVAALSGTGVLQFIASKIPNAPLWLTQTSFNTIGGILPAITVFAALLPVSVVRVMKGKNMVVETVVLVLLVSGLASSLYHALPGKPDSPRLLPVETGWSIALETLKRSPLLGVGPGNYVEAFNRFRSADYNNTSVWNLRFSSSSNFYLEVWTVTGLLGIVALLWLVWRIVRASQGSPLSPTHYALLTTLVIFLLVPVGFVLLSVFYILLAVLAGSRGSDLSFQFAAQGNTGRKSNFMSWFFVLVASSLLIGAGVYTRGVYAAELSYKQALNSVAANDGLGAYNTLIRAINQNPGVDRYRLTYSQINLALANNIAAKQDLTDQDRQTVSQLIQQAIREGQATVALNRGRSGNWENLARIYQAVMPFAQGADQFAIQTYQQAIALDPVNPNLRIALGGVYYALGQYEEAVKVFEVAALAKPDLANAHYNLAVALREKKDVVRASQEMNATLSLVSPGTPDYDKAKAELDELQKKVAEEATPSAKIQPVAGQQTPLQAPQPAPTPVIEPPLELPESASPPATESGEPTPIPAPTP